MKGGYAVNTGKLNAFAEKLKKFTSTDAFCFILPLVVLSTWLITLVLRGKVEKASGYYILYYLYTFDRGLITRGGITGEVISRFFDTVSPELTVQISAFLSAVLVLVSSICIGLALKKTKNEPETRSVVLFFIILLCVLPVSFRIFLVDQKFDKLLWAIALLCVLLSEKKATVILVPALCVLATLINSVFLFTSMFLVSLVLLQNFYDSRYSKYKLAICFFAYSSMIATALISLAVQKNIQFDSAAEMVDYFFSRYTGELSPSDRQRIIYSCVNDYFEPFSTYFVKAINEYGIARGNWKPCLFHLLFLGVPCFTCFSVFWLNAIKAESNKFQKFVFILCMVFPLVTIPLTVFTWEASRYTGNSLLVQMCLLVYYIVHKNPAVISSLKKSAGFVKRHSVLSAICAAYFAMYIF